MMKKQRRPCENLFKIVSIIAIAAFGLLSLPFQAEGQIKSSSLLTRLTARSSSRLNAALTYSPRFPVVGQTVRFEDISTGSPQSWQWDFGDGSTSTARNPTHVYASPGFHRVTLIAADGTASKKSTRTLMIIDAERDASFGFSPSTPGPGQTVQFTDTTPESPTSWSWTFGDGATNSGKNPTHAFAKAGNYTVNLVATTSSGLKQASKTVTVASMSVLSSSFTYTPATPSVGQAIDFTDTSTGSPTSWSWNFGDGSTSTLQNSRHAYATAGSKTVTLTVTNSSGSKSVSRTVTVVAALAASFTYSPNSPSVSQSIQFTDASTGSPTSWSWSFGDGSTSTLQNPGHAYATAGSKTVSLTVTNSSGSNSVSRTVTVMAALAASFTYSPNSPALSQSIQFTDTSAGSPTSWSWNFGDGSTSTLQNPGHAYATAGSKTVSLTVTNSSGSNSVSRTVTVVAALAASFTYSPNSPSVSQSIQFTDASTGSPTSWSWSFGDGSTSTLQNPGHAYATAGSKTVSLTVTNSSGSNSVSRTVTVMAALAASFTYSPNSPALSQSIQFTDTSAGSPTSWSWSFGDGSTSMSRNPAHAFAAAGSYSVTLTASNATSSSSATRTVTVAANPSVVAAFTVSPAAPAEGQSVQFVDASTGSPTAWSWNFGDGSTSALQNPTHSFATTGSYSVTLVASNASSSSSATNVVTVAANPGDLAASFTFSLSSPKIGDTVQFTDTSTGSPLIWLWNFGDDTTSMIQNPSHAYSTLGSKTVTLTVSNGSGSNSASRTVAVADSSPSINLADRWIDWSGAGVPGGIAQYRDGGVNARPRGVSVADYGADPTGAKNCSTAFANAQSACPAGSYIFIPNGTYLLSGSVSLASNRTWRGQSVAGTIIKLSGGGEFASPAEWPAPTYASNGISVTAGATKGSRVLTVASTATFSVGGLVQLTQLTPSYMHANSSNSWTAESWFGYDGSRLSSIMFTVAAVDSAARTVTLDHPLPMDMTSSPLLMARATLHAASALRTCTFDCTNSTSNQVDPDRQRHLVLDLRMLFQTDVRPLGLVRGVHEHHLRAQPLGPRPGPWAATAKAWISSATLVGAWCRIMSFIPPDIR